MKVTVLEVLVLMAFIHVTGASRPWYDLSVRYDFIKSNGFYQMPRTTKSKLINDYVKVKPESDFNLALDFYCYPNDPRACLMFDKTGNVAGVQTSFVKNDFAKVQQKDFNYTALIQSNFIETNFFNISAYSFRMYFTNPENLTENGRENIYETADGLWTYLERNLVQIPRNEPKDGELPNFYMQGCLRSMGVHYFYKVEKKLSDCREYFPLFLLYEEGSLVGYGLVTVGIGPKDEKDWYEYPPKLALPLIAPNRPQCLDDLHWKYGLTSMHVYLVHRPWNIACHCFDKIINVLAKWTPFG